MEYITQRKTFSVKFSQLDRWNVSFFKAGKWNWPSSVIHTIGEVTNAETIQITVKEAKEKSIPIIAKINFSGELYLRGVEDYENYKGKLFIAKPGRLIFSKINARRGCIHYVPIGHKPFAVSNEYPVLFVDETQIDGKYLDMALRAGPAKDVLTGAAAGMAKARTYLSDIQSVKIPIPEISVQQEIVAYWEAAIAKASLLEDKSKATIDESLRTSIHALGLSIPKKQESEKVFIRQWKDFDRWSVSYNQATSTMMDLSKGKFPVVELRAVLDLVQYGTSEKTNSSREGVGVIRMNNIVDGDLDLSNLKHLKVSKDTEKSLKLLNGDILINRTNSKELVGKCAVFDKNETYIFASYLIRLRVDAEKADPHFVAFTINGPIGRQQINALSRQIIGQANINSQEIRSLKLPLPDLKVQQKIIKKVNKAQYKAASLRTEAKELLGKANIGIERMILGTCPVENI
jgi:type I restriction enzyme S subunit